MAQVPKVLAVPDPARTGRTMDLWFGGYPPDRMINPHLYRFGDPPPYSPVPLEQVLLNRKGQGHVQFDTTGMEPGDWFVWAGGLSFVGSFRLSS
jgi:hypothetical protein